MKKAKLKEEVLWLASLLADYVNERMDNGSPYTKTVLVNDDVHERRMEISRIEFADKGEVASTVYMIIIKDWSEITKAYHIKTEATITFDGLLLLLDIHEKV